MIAELAQDLIKVPASRLPTHLVDRAPLYAPRARARHPAGGCTEVIHSPTVCQRSRRTLHEERAENRLPGSFSGGTFGHFCGVAAAVQRLDPNLDQDWASQQTWGFRRRCVPMRFLGRSRHADRFTVNAWVRFWLGSGQIVVLQRMGPMSDRSSRDESWHAAFPKPLLDALGPVNPGIRL